MGDDPPFRRKHILHYLMYVALIGLCLAGILYLLMQARPQIAPKVKNGTDSRLVQPARQEAFCS